MPSSRRVQVLAGGLTLVVLAGGVSTAVSLQADDAEAQEYQRSEAREDLDDEVNALHGDLAASARDGEQAAERLRATLADTVVGTDDRGAKQVRRDLGDDAEAMRAAADELRATAQRTELERPDELNPGAIAPLFDELELLAEQAATTADRFERAADDAERVGGRAQKLTTAAETYADATDTLPNTDDPDTLAAAWDDELGLLSDYQRAAADVATSEQLAPIADEHREFANDLKDLAREAIDDLEAGDIDAYNARLDDALDGETARVGTRLERGAERVFDRRAFTRLEDARERGLGLSEQIDELDALSPAD